MVPISYNIPHPNKLFYYYVTHTHKQKREEKGFKKGTGTKTNAFQLVQKTAPGKTAEPNDRHEITLHLTLLARDSEGASMSITQKMCKCLWGGGW